jgi:K+-sensing histidine kinase KdpD
MVQQVQAERQAIEQQLCERSRFLATLSHELRSPLNAVIGFADVLAEGQLPPDSPKRAQYAQHIARGGRHLLQLINDVLELSQIDSGVYRFSPEPVELPRLIANVLDVLHTQVVRKSLRAAVEVDPSLGTVVVDPAALKRALLNCLARAVATSAEGGLISVRAQPQGAGRFSLSVEGGRGNPLADAPASGPEPAALDLALTRRLVEAQGGEFCQRSAAGARNVTTLVLRHAHPPVTSEANDTRRAATASGRPGV